MLDDFQIGKGNRRSITTRRPWEGGELERQEAARYRTWAKAIAYQHLHTAKALDPLAQPYEWEARRRDEDAERLHRERQSELMPLLCYCNLPNCRFVIPDSAKASGLVRASLVR